MLRDVFPPAALCVRFPGNDSLSLPHGVGRNKNYPILFFNVVRVRLAVNVYSRHWLVSSNGSLSHSSASSMSDSASFRSVSGPAENLTCDAARCRPISPESVTAYVGSDMTRITSAPGMSFRVSSSHTACMFAATVSSSFMVFDFCFSCSFPVCLFRIVSGCLSLVYGRGSRHGDSPPVFLSASALAGLAESLWPELASRQAGRRLISHTAIWIASSSALRWSSRDSHRLARAT